MQVFDIQEVGNAFGEANEELRGLVEQTASLGVGFVMAGRRCDAASGEQLGLDLDQLATKQIDQVLSAGGVAQPNQVAYQLGGSAVLGSAALVTARTDEVLAR